MLIDICKKLHENSLSGFQVIVLTRLRHNFVTDKVPKAITRKALMQELQFLNSACHLILVDICIKIHEDSLKTFQVVERTRLRRNLVMVEVPWEITQEVSMQELWFLHSAYPLILVDICMKFHDASLYGLKVIELTRWRQDFVKDNVQRETTQKIKMQELLFLHSAHRLMLVDICMKFHDASLYGLKSYRADTMETRFC